MSDDLTRSDMALVRQACNNGWKVPDDVRAKILKRLIQYIDTETVAGQLAEPRIVVAAARTVVVADLSQQKIDLAREKLDGGGNKGTLADLVGEAEERAQRVEREREARRPPGPVL